MLRNLTEYLGEEAKSKGVEFISDLPADSIVIDGLESRFFLSGNFLHYRYVPYIILTKVVDFSYKNTYLCIIIYIYIYIMLYYINPT